MVSAYYHLLVGRSEQFFPWNSIWKQKIPSRVASFIWIAALGKCLTIDNLRKRKVCILDWCYMCKCNSETVDHLFLYCSVALELWDIVFGLFGVCWVMPMFVLSFLLAGKVDLVAIVMEIYELLFLIVWCGVFGRKEIVSVLKTTGFLCLISSFYFSKPYWTGSKCGETNLFLQVWIYLIHVIFVFDMYTPIYPLCTWVSLFFITINLYYLSKKKKLCNKPRLYDLYVPTWRKVLQVILY